MTIETRGPPPYEYCRQCGAASPAFVTRKGNDESLALGWRQIDEYRWLCPAHAHLPAIRFIPKERIIDLLYQLAKVLAYERSQMERPNYSADKLLKEMDELLLTKATADQ